MVLAIDDGEFDRELSQRSSRLEPAKPGSDDHNPTPVFLHEALLGPDAILGWQQASEPYIDSFMAEKSEVFSAAESTASAGGKVESQGRSTAQVEAHSRRDFIEIAIVFACIMLAIWTAPGKLNSIFSIIASTCVVAFAIAGRWGARELGLTRPLAGVGPILLTGAILCGLIAFVGLPLRFAGPGWGVPLGRSWQYAIWALQQEFILQSIFFVRLEAMLGSRRAVFAAATLFAVAHIPSPGLTVLAFSGGVVFCELFRRARNLYPLGIIHAALGLTIAASLPDHWLHHMRVGISYLILHS
jgi:hypothetical protein